MWFLFGEVSSSSGCWGWATLFYCDTPWAFHIIIIYVMSENSKLKVKTSISKITASRLKVANFKSLAYAFPDDAYKCFDIDGNRCKQTGIN